MQQSIRKVKPRYRIYFYAGNPDYCFRLPKSCYEVYDYFFGWTNITDTNEGDDIIYGR